MITKIGVPRADKFMYCDTFRTPEVVIDDNSDFVIDHLDPSDYPFQWGDIKLPKGQSWEKHTVVDKEYMFSKISFYDAGDDLYVRFKTGNGKGFEIISINHLAQQLQDYIQAHVFDKGLAFNVCVIYKQPAIYLTLRDYKKHTFFEVWKKSYNWGRHWENGLKRIYRELSIQYPERRYL